MFHEPHDKFAAEEKKTLSFLVVSARGEERGTLKQQLHALDIKQVSDASDLYSALKKLQERRFSHMIFSVSEQEDPLSFISAALHHDSQMVAIAASAVPDIDEMFDLLAAGAKSYLVYPISKENLGEVIAMATHGDPIPPEMLTKANRIQFLASVLADDLDRAAAVKKKGGMTLPPLSPTLSQSVRRTLLMNIGGREEYMRAMEEYLVVRSREPATRLGKLRRRLAELRNVEK